MEVYVLQYICNKIILTVKANLYWLDSCVIVSMEGVHTLNASL